MNAQRSRALVWCTYAVALAAVIAATGCSELFDPCPDPGKYFPEAGSNKDKFMTGTWHLDTVDGRSLPYALPGGAGTLTVGNIDFNTLYLDAGSCGSPKKSRGEIIALYHITKGGADTRDTQAGSFEFNNASNAVTLRALGYAIVGNAQLNSFISGSTLDVVAPIPVPISGDVNYRLHFTRY